MESLGSLLRQKVNSMTYMCWPSAGMTKTPAIDKSQKL